jgi:dihydrofolate synthase/folylpolyglutamate synthase
MHLSINSSLDEWLCYIESIHPTEIDLGLTRLQAVAGKLLGNSGQPFVFTVAGTNGKGSTTAVLTALSLAAGETVGWYTSPHILRFNERIVINGQPVNDAQLVEAFCVVEAARGETTLSYFEFTTLAAFYLFSRENLSVWVLEVGLGGRLDAVNIVDPDVAVVTTIGLDHQSFLGTDLNAIGAEKAGICRNGKPVVLGSANLPESVVETARATGAFIYPFGVNHGVTEHEIYWQGGHCAVSDISMPLDNVATAVQAFALSPFQLHMEQVSDVVHQLSMAGRFQKASYRQSEVVVDVGHNPLAGAYIAARLAHRRLHFIIGMLEDKDAKGFVEALMPVVKTLSFVSLSGHRGLSAQALADKVAIKGAQCFDSMADALEATYEAYPGESIFIGGSFLTVAAALSILEK